MFGSFPVVEGGVVANGLSGAGTAGVAVAVTCGLADQLTPLRSQVVPPGSLVNVPLALPLVGKDPLTLLTPLVPVNAWFVIAEAGNVPSGHPAAEGSWENVRSVPVEETVKRTVPRPPLIEPV